MKKHQERIARREARLAQNLRANLLRRKSQARQRQREGSLEHLSLSVTRFSDKKCGGNKELEHFVEHGETKNDLERNKGGDEVMAPDEAE